MDRNRSVRSMRSKGGPPPRVVVPRPEGAAYIEQLRRRDMDRERPQSVALLPVRGKGFGEEITRPDTAEEQVTCAAVLVDAGPATIVAVEPSRLAAFEQGQAFLARQRGGAFQVCRLGALAAVFGMAEARRMVTEWNASVTYQRSVEASEGALQRQEALPALPSVEPWDPE